MAREEREAPGAPRAIQSQGEAAAKAYVVGEVAPRPLQPTVEMERVHVEDPRRVPPPRAEARRGSGPRNPEQRAPLADVGAPGVTTPEGLPVTKRQPIVIDSELLAQWHEGRGGRGGEGEGGEPRGAEAGGGPRGAEAVAACRRRGGPREQRGPRGGEGGGPRGEGGSGRPRAARRRRARGAGRTSRLAEVAAARRTARRAGRQRAAWVLAMGVLLAIGVAVARSGRGARDGASEVPRSGAERCRARRRRSGGGGTAAESARAPGASAAGRRLRRSRATAPVASGTARARDGAVASGTAPVASGAAPVASGTAPVASAAPGGAAVAARPAPRSQPPPAAMTAQQSRSGAPAAARRAPGASGSAAPAREGPDAPRATSPYDTPNFD
ncbi:uncharacterized protein SOCE836_088770 [Sorangium cellulosum]|uniref:Uncharacterized protein n=1 Tax=Sorangium cellulosum TaxID=56 RepID=A0A4P2R167_SORCE|nr:hypothetical protein [Sorangium cellulosum]AUX36669.1 uncharacterized protein SOCE836_088770 [Sorangium cellulosum]